MPKRKLPYEDEVPVTPQDPDRRVLEFTGDIDWFCNPKFSEVRIRLDNFEFPAHRLVLAAKSQYFAQAMMSGFKEGQTCLFQYYSDSGSMYADLRCFDYMYTGAYANVYPIELATALNATDDDELSMHTRVYVLADYFGIADLKKYSLANFTAKVLTPPNAERFIDCAREVYRSTRPSCRMRWMVAATAKQYLDMLWNQGLQDLVREEGDFAVDLLAAVKPQ